jgi:hypothetical protein
MEFDNWRTYKPEDFFHLIDKKLNDINWSLSKTNEVLHLLIGQSFEQKDKLTDYLDQDFLNKTHCDWVFSQQQLVDIDAMRFNSHAGIAEIGNKLHEIYPDKIRIIKIAEAMIKLGYIYPYEEVNLSVHRLENCFKKNNLEFSGKSKWEVFDNPVIDTVVSNNNIVNFSFFSSCRHMYRRRGVLSGKERLKYKCYINS